MIICTVTSLNNLYRAKVMANSVREHHPEAKIIVCLVEKEYPPDIPAGYFDEIILARHLNIPSFPNFMFKYWIYEGVTALKPFIIQYAIGKYDDEENFVFLDTDIRIYHPLDELLSLLDSHRIVLTAQQLEAESCWPRIIRLGVYNTGVFALRRSGEAEQFINWWSERLYTYCYSDEPHYVDQRWVDLAPAYFETFIMKHPGYNAAAWSIHEQQRRQVYFHDNRPYIEGFPLCCFHYSGMSGFLRHCMDQVYPERQGAMYELLGAYKRELTEEGGAEAEGIPWSYDYFSSGERIWDITRQKCKSNPSLLSKFVDPYGSGNNSY